MGIRPIVSSCSSITENISEYVDIWLQQPMRQLPSFIRDTTDFIQLVEKTILPEECILATIDVSSLYTNIPHTEGKHTAMKALNAIENPDPRQPPAEVIGEIIDTVLHNNVFEFNGNYYLQIQGTEMGTKMASAYANLFMGDLEPNLQALGHTHIMVWKRFIDDIFIISKGTKVEFLEYMDRINTIHHSIKFTHECSEQEIDFLDATIYKGDRFQVEHILDVKTHIKPTNKQLYVHASSYHPPNTGKSIAIGEANRYVRTNSDGPHYNAMTTHLTEKFRQRGYKTRNIHSYISSVNYSDRPKKT